MQISPKQAVQIVQHIVDAALLNKRDRDLAEASIAVLAALAAAAQEEKSP